MSVLSISTKINGSQVMLILYPIILHGN